MTITAFPQLSQTADTNSLQRTVHFLPHLLEGSNRLVDRVLDSGPGVPGSVGRSGRNFVFHWFRMPMLNRGGPTGM